MPKRDHVAHQIGLPPADAGTASAYNQQLQQLYAAYRDSRGLLRESNAQQRAAFGITEAQVLQQQQQGLSEAESGAIERGVLGSSADFKARTDVRAQATMTLTQAAQLLSQGLLQNKAQALQLQRDYEAGLAGAQTGLTNARAGQAAQNLIYDNPADPRSHLTQPQAENLQGMQNTFQGKLRQWAAVKKSLGGADVASPEYHELMQAWQSRNALRKKLGLPALPDDTLMQLMWAATHGGHRPPRQIGR